MIPFYAELLNRLRGQHNDIEKAIEGLRQEALDWKPEPEMNSMCALIVHIAGAERFLIGDIVKGEPSQRDRPAEFMATGWDALMLMKRLRDSEAYFGSVLETLSLADLEGVRQDPRDGSQVPVSWRCCTRWNTPLCIADRYKTCTSCIGIEGDEFFQTTWGYLFRGTAQGRFFVLVHGAMQALRGKDPRAGGHAQRFEPAIRRRRG
jgi:hypothetical protein